MIGVSAVGVWVLGLLAFPADPVFGDAKLGRWQRRLIVADPAKRRAVLKQLAELTRRLEEIGPERATIASEPEILNHQILTVEAEIKAHSATSGSGSSAKP